LTDTKALEVLVEPIATAMGFDLVRVALMKGAGGLTLQVMAEDPATRQLTIDQCAALSRRVSDMLDEVDPIADEYHLEVSSPGIDRPLTRLQDFADWAGYVAKFQLTELLEGRKRLQGHILGLDDAMVRIAVEGLGETAVPFANIAGAKLVLTDDLIKATKPLSSEGVDALDEEEEEDD
jgi:ribosome maturation factor RimP|tara:strand:- start:67967 stop:68503 length:537 start_codon:yes stop_codon:yes gene_type:complete